MKRSHRRRGFWLWYDVHHNTELVVSTVEVDGAVVTKTAEIGNATTDLPIRVEKSLNSRLCEQILVGKVQS